MNPFTNLGADIEAFRANLTATAGHLVSEFEDLLGKIAGQAKTDAVQVAHDAEPVIAEAEHDAAALATEAVTGTEDIVNPPKANA